MTAVKGFSDISYDELMDVNGGATAYIETTCDVNGTWKTEAGIMFDNGSSIYVSVGSNGVSGGYRRCW